MKIFMYGTYYNIIMASSKLTKIKDEHIKIRYSAVFILYVQDLYFLYIQYYYYIKQFIS